MQELKILWSSNPDNREEIVQFLPIFYPFKECVELFDEEDVEQSQKCFDHSQQTPKPTLISTPKTTKSLSQLSKKKSSSVAAVAAQPVPTLLFGLKPKPVSFTPISSRKRNVDSCWFGNAPNFKAQRETKKQRHAKAVSPVALLLQTEREQSKSFQKKLELINRSSTTSSQA